MGARHEFLDFLLDQLAPLGGVSARRMFGGAGIYKDGRMFALVDSNYRMFMKADDTTRARFVTAGCAPFTYAVKGRPSVTMSYYALPEEALEDQEALLEWAHIGIMAARDQAKGKGYRSE